MSLCSNKQDKGHGKECSARAGAADDGLQMSSTLFGVEVVPAHWKQCSKAQSWGGRRVGAADREESGAAKVGLLTSGCPW